MYREVLGVIGTEKQVESCIVGISVIENALLTHDVSDW